MSRRRGNIRTWILLILALVPTTAVIAAGLSLWSDRGNDIARAEASTTPIDTSVLVYEIVAAIGRADAAMQAAAQPGASPAVLATADAEMAEAVTILRDSTDVLEANLERLAADGDGDGRIGLLPIIVSQLPNSADIIEAHTPGEAAGTQMQFMLAMTRTNATGLVLPAERTSQDVAYVYANLATAIEYHKIFDGDRSELIAALGSGDLAQVTEIARSPMRAKAWEDLVQARQLPLAGTAAINWPLTPADPSLPEAIDTAEPLGAAVERVLGSERASSTVALGELSSIDTAIGQDIALAHELINERAAEEIADLREERLLTALATGVMSVVGLALLLLTVSEVRQRQSIERAHGEAIDLLADKADRDPTTGAWNRRHLEASLPGLLLDCEHSDESVVLAYIDLDSFKAINDVWGHHTGDRVLRIVTERLANFAIEDVDFELIRFGGDEFVIYATIGGVDIDWLENFGHRVLQTLSNPMSIDGREHGVSASMGITMSDADSTLDSLLLEADSSLILAKRAKRGTAIVYNRRISRTGELVHALPNALADDEIDCHLQPVFDMRTGRVSHAEALARWFRPNGESVSPGVFVPLVESFGLAEQLTANMLRSVATIIDAPSTPANVRIWVNLSPRELEVANFAHRFADGLRKAGLRPNRVGLEITETAAVRDPDALAIELAKVRNIGVKIAIDDFGNGYSPLGFLRNLPVDTVKLDRSLITHIDVDPANQHIVRGIVGMLQELGVSITAEGVERVEEEAWLAAHGVDAIQGFLRGRPVPPAEFDWHATSLPSNADRAMRSPSVERITPVAGA